MMRKQRTLCEAGKRTRFSLYLYTVRQVEKLNPTVANSVALLLMMNPIYSKTQFKTNAYTVAWPSCFAIITAYATTGETWTASENEHANNLLKELFELEGVWHEAITGYDPETGHEEPVSNFEINTMYISSFSGLGSKNIKIY